MGINVTPTKTRFREGDRVRMAAAFGGVVPRGTRGTVAVVAGARGKSIYPDPSRLMLFVHWDTGLQSGDFQRWIAKLTPAEIAEERAARLKAAV